MIKKENITFDDGFISINGFGRIGMWWNKYDKKVTLDYSLKLYLHLNNDELEFFAETWEEVQNKIIQLAWRPQIK